MTARRNLLRRIPFPRETMKRHRPSAGALRSAGLVLALGVATLCAACDGDIVSTRWNASSEQGLQLVTSDVSDGVHAGRGAIRLEFDRPVDAASVGPRSVRVERPGGRRVRRVQVWSSGASVFVAPPPERAFPTDVDLRLRIEGGGSPRSLRALDGTALGAATDLTFRVLQRRRSDLEGPRLLESLPAAGATDAAPGSHVQLVFDEPLARAPVRSGEGVIVRVDGLPVPARLRLSPDLTRLVVRPRQHLPPGAHVSVEVQPSLLDLSGNPAETVQVAFRTRATRLRELSEDFVTTDMLDGAGTTGGWALPEAPGFLVARAGRLQWAPLDGGTGRAALPAAERVRFQVLFPAVDAPGGIASALRVHLTGADEGDVLPSAAVDLGVTTLFRVDPTFEANRRASDLQSFASMPESLPVEVDEDGAPYVDVTFDAPAVLLPRTALLVDVELLLPLGVRVAASQDPGALALVENLGAGVLVPAVDLLVSGGPPQARSAWWDSGVTRPGWQKAVVSGAATAGEDYVIEFQTAAATPDGVPDLDRASEWGPELSQQPALRFVRFRITFARLAPRGSEIRIDRVVLPYQD